MLKVEDMKRISVGVMGKVGGVAASEVILCIAALAERDDEIIRLLKKIAGDESQPWAPRCAKCKRFIRADEQMEELFVEGGHAFSVCLDCFKAETGEESDDGSD